MFKYDKTVKPLEINKISSAICRLYIVLMHTHMAQIGNNITSSNYIQFIGRKSDFRNHKKRFIFDREFGFIIIFILYWFLLFFIYVRHTH